MDVDVIGRVLITGATGMLGLALTALCDERRPSRATPIPRRTSTSPTPPPSSAAVRPFRGRAGRRPPGGAWSSTPPPTPTSSGPKTTKSARSPSTTAGARNVARPPPARAWAGARVHRLRLRRGQETAPYTEEDEPQPLNAYGRSKLAGERSVVAGLSGGAARAHRLGLRPGRQQLPAQDPRAGPHARRAAGGRRRDRLAHRHRRPGPGHPRACGASGATGLFHLAGSGSCSRYEMAAGDRGRGGLADPGGAGAARRRSPPRPSRPANSGTERPRRPRELGVATARPGGSRSLRRTYCPGALTWPRRHQAGRA